MKFSLTLVLVPVVAALLSSAAPLAAEIEVSLCPRVSIHPTAIYSRHRPATATGPSSGVRLHNATWHAEVSAARDLAAPEDIGDAATRS